MEESILQEKHKVFVGCPQSEVEFVEGYLTALAADPDNEFNFRKGSTYKKSELTDILTNHNGTLSEANPRYLTFLEELSRNFYESDPKKSGTRVTVFAGEIENSNWKYINRVKPQLDNLQSILQSRGHDIHYNI